MQDIFKIVKLRDVCNDKSQPRKTFDEEKLNELAESIRTYGLIEPLIVREERGFYIIIAGERRWRAARIAGLYELPVIVREYTSQQIAEVSIIENIQREDLNPIEEALGYKRLQEEFGLTQEIIAGKVGKSRVYITNALRILKLPSSVYPYIISGQITSGHARTLLGVQEVKLQLELVDKIVNDNITVRELEEFVKNLKETKKEKPVKVIRNIEQYKKIEERLQAKLGSKVNVTPKTDCKGEIKISYYSIDELEGILEKMRYTE